MIPRSSAGGRPTKQQALDLDNRIRSVAIATFIEKGFAGASMEEIAKRARVSKPTLYARFADKSALFTSVIPYALETPVWSPPPVVTAGSLLDALTAMARAFLDRAQDPDTVALLRVTIAESHQFPELVMTQESVRRSPRVAATMEVIHRYAALGEIADEEMAGRQFLAQFSMAPMLLAVSGLLELLERTDDDLRRAVAQFLDGARSG